MHQPSAGVAMHDPDPDYTPTPPNRPQQPGKQPYGPMPDQDPAPPQGPHHLPGDPVSPEQDALRAYAGLERAALLTRVGA